LPQDQDKEDQPSCGVSISMVVAIVLWRKVNRPSISHPEELSPTDSKEDGQNILQDSSGACSKHAHDWQEESVLEK